jgi:hypothetical protein
MLSSETGFLKKALFQEPTTKKKKFVWRNSKAKALLKNDMVSGEIPVDNEDMPAGEVFQRRPRRRCCADSNNVESRSGNCRRVLSSGPQVLR